MIFQRGLNTGIANSSHSYGLMSSKLQNSGHHRPLEWYFNGVKTLALPTLHIPMPLWVQSCKIPATIDHWNDVNGVLALLLRNTAMAFWVQSCQIPANIAHWNYISMGIKHWHCQFLTFLRPYDFKTLATIAPWNDISKHWHFQFFTFPWPHEFKVAKFRPR